MKNIFAREKYIGSFVDWHKSDGSVSRLEIVEIDNSSYPLICNDHLGFTEVFTKDGRSTVTSHPCLKWSPEQTVNWDYGTPPEGN